MKLLRNLTLFPLTGLLMIGCNSTGLTHKNVDAIPGASVETSRIVVYKKREQIPANLKIQGIAQVQNQYPDGSKVSSLDILEGLKRQAVMVGGVGITHVTPGTLQTTADILIHK